MNLHELEVFLAVAREKNFSRAAKVLFRTQPAVSLAIRRLETDLGETLFDRSGKVAALTDAGQMLLGYAERLVNLRGEIRPALAELHNLERGRVRVGANETGALYLLPLIARYRRLHPQVKVEIVRSLARSIPQELHKRNLDLGVLSYRPEDKQLASVVVYRDRLSFIVYPTHRLARRPRVSIRQLGQETFAAHNIWSPYRERGLRTLWKKRGAPHMEVEIPELRVERTLRVVYRRGDPLSHAARAFLKVVASHAGAVAKPVEAAA